MVLPEIKSLFSLANQLNTQIEYWKEYKGQEVIIGKHSVKRTREEQDIGPTAKRIQQTSYLIRGEVEDVMSFPRGFQLRNVKEYVASDDYRELSTPESQKLSPTKSGTHNVRQLDRKFVSFDVIEELEWAEDADNATKPQREQS